MRLPWSRSGRWRSIEGFHVWCKACRHSGNADLDALIRSGKGDIPLVRLMWRCGHCRSDLTDFVMTGSHYGPSRADLCKIGSTCGGLKPCRKPAGRTFASWNMIQPLMPFLSVSNAAAFGESWRRTLQS